MADLVPKPTIDLVARLAALTRGGHLEWIPGSSPTEFVLVRPEGSIVIYSKDEDGLAPFEIRILDPEGVEVESYDTQAFGDNSGLLRALFVAARASSVKASKVVESLLENLPADDIPF